MRFLSFLDDDSLIEFLLCADREALSLDDINQKTSSYWAGSSVSVLSLVALKKDELFPPNYGGSEDATSASRPTAYSTAYAPRFVASKVFDWSYFYPGFKPSSQSVA